MTSTAGNSERVITTTERLDIPQAPSTPGMEPSVPDQSPLGGSVPPNTSHAVSVSLPSWKANVGYEEGEDWVVSAMTTGYPRFYVHSDIQALAAEVVRRFGTSEDSATLFPSPKAAAMCHQFFRSNLPVSEAANVRTVNLVMPATIAQSERNGGVAPTISSRLSCVLYPKKHAGIAKQVWQHAGAGISSRRSEFCLKALLDGHLVEEPAAGSSESAQKLHKGPKRYQRNGSVSNTGRTPEKKPSESQEYDQFVEERFGRNLSTSLASNAKLAVRRRIAGSLAVDADLTEISKASLPHARIPGLTEDHVYLFPSGMNAIFTTHQVLMSGRGQMKSICYGFPYIDTLKILQKWGPGALFYPHGSSEELDNLEERLKSGERYLALFTEFPGNPLLKSPDLERIRALADEYDFAVVVDESVGNFINVNVLPKADVVVSSLTKIFSGDSNVMGGSAVLNPLARNYQSLKDTFAKEYEDDYWAEDAVFMERNSRDFVSRIERINSSAETLTSHLRDAGLVKALYYPKYNPTKELYDKFRNHNGGYGGLFSVTFHSKQEATAFFDTLDVMKGPSLGTNFTLSCPYTILAHYGELEWAKSCGVDSNLVRVSVGLEDPAELMSRFQRAIDAAKRQKAA